MRDGDRDFVKLDNIRDAFKNETKINPDYEDYLRSSGAGAVSSEDLGEGVIRFVISCCLHPTTTKNLTTTTGRHTFEDTVYIEIARWRDPQCVADVYKFWPLFIDKARMIKRSCGEEHKFAISDLLFGLSSYYDDSDGLAIDSHDNHQLVVFFFLQSRASGAIIDTEASLST